MNVAGIKQSERLGAVYAHEKENSLRKIILRGFGTELMEYDEICQDCHWTAHGVNSQKPKKTKCILQGTKV